jgi:hypothetical protein
MPEGEGELLPNAAHRGLHLARRDREGSPSTSADESGKKLPLTAPVCRLDCPLALRITFVQNARLLNKSLLHR